MGLPFLALSRLCKSIVQPRFYGYPEEATLLVSTGYILCLLMLLIGALLQAIVARRGRSIQTLGFFVLGIVFLWLLWPWGMMRR